MATTQKVCRYDDKCTRSDCYFLHPSRETGSVIQEKPKIKVCRFDDKCTRPDCYFSHPSRNSAVASVEPAKTKPNQTICRFDDKCTRQDCYFFHPSRSVATLEPEMEEQAQKLAEKMMEENTLAQITAERDALSVALEAAKAEIEKLKVQMQVPEVS